MLFLAPAVVFPRQTKRVAVLFVWFYFGEGLNWTERAALEYPLPNVLGPCDASVSLLLPVCAKCMLVP